MKLTGRRILVVGGSRGIGAAVARGARDAGAEVVVASRTRGNWDGEWWEWDVTREDGVQEVEGNLDGVVYCPGSVVLKPFGSLRGEVWRQEWELNVMGAVRVLQRCERALFRGEGVGSVVLVSSVAAGVGMRYHACVGTVKGAVEGLGRSLAAEWAPRVRVNVVAPSLTNTMLAGRLLETEEKRKAVAERHPLTGYNEAEDVAGMILFLLGDGARRVTGEVWRVDGGVGAVRV
ncbi:MAG: SDR family oxidoreductase [Methylacidiphilales bacterium]|nr:SDR family oxidoreductase [Candidatus Methylacidiphilales bacterium]MDW8350141.1 SDR family oxidoreductase [Verrucomicrobiae bacterium]